MFIFREERDAPCGDDTSVCRELQTFGELGFRGSGAGLRSGSLLSHLLHQISIKSAANASRASYQTT